MKCYLCNEDKLSKEFPFYPLTEHCNHPLLHCLDCSTASVQNNNKCSQCDSIVDEDNKRYKEYLKTLSFLFPNDEFDIEDDASNSEMVIGSEAEGDITVVTMSGEEATFAYQAQKKILDIKKEIEMEFKTPPQNQRLLYKDKELKIEGETALTLGDFNVPPNSTLHLIITLCHFSEDLETAVFDFCWSLPTRNRKDYLDVSVFVYSGNSSVGDLPIYYRNRSLSDCPGVTHSGPADMDYEKQEGHHRVDISLKLVPHHVDKLVFTLSSWRSSSISAYRSRRLRFYDVDFPDKQLCSDEMQREQHRESIILCYLSRAKGKWSVTSLKCGADGSTTSFHKSYCPLRDEIEKLIKRGIIK